MSRPRLDQRVELGPGLGLEPTVPGHGVSIPVHSLDALFEVLRRQGLDPVRMSQKNRLDSANRVRVERDAVVPITAPLANDPGDGLVARQPRRTARRWLA